MRARILTEIQNNNKRNNYLWTLLITESDHDGESYNVRCREAESFEPRRQTLYIADPTPGERREVHLHI